MSKQTYNFKTDEELFPYLFDSNKLPPEAPLIRELMEDELADIASGGVKPFDYTYESGIRREKHAQVLAIFRGDELLHSEVLSEWDETYHYDNEFDVVSSEISRQRESASYKLRKKALEYVDAPIDKFPNYTYDFGKKKKLDINGETYTAGKVNVFKDFDEYYSPEKCYGKSYKEIKESICSRKSRHWIKILIMAFLTCVCLIKGNGFLGFLAEKVSDPSIFYVKEPSIFLLPMLLVGVILLGWLCMYDFSSAINRYEDWSNTKFSISFIIQIFAAAIALIVILGESFLGYFVNAGSASLFPELYNSLTKELPLSGYPVLYLGVMTIIEFICMLDLFKKQSDWRLHYLRDVRTLVEKLDNDLEPRYKAYRFFSIWGERRAAHISNFDKEYKLYGKRYCKLQAILTKYKKLIETKLESDNRKK